MLHFNNWLQYYEHMDAKNVMLVDNKLSMKVDDVAFAVAERCEL